MSSFSIARYRKHWLLHREHRSPKRFFDNCKACSNFIAERFDFSLNLICTATDVRNLTVHCFDAVQRRTNALSLPENRSRIHLWRALFRLCDSVLNDEPTECNG